MIHSNHDPDQILLALDSSVPVLYMNHFSFDRDYLCRLPLILWPIYPSLQRPFMYRISLDFLLIFLPIVKVAHGKIFIHLQI